MYNKSGNSLLVVLLGVVTVGVLLSSLSSMLLNISRMHARQEVKEKMAILSTEIRLFWAEPTFCAESFTGVTIDTTSTDDNPQVIDMESVTTNGIRFDQFRPDLPFQLKEVHLVHLEGPFNNRHVVRAKVLLEP